MKTQSLINILFVLVITISFVSCKKYLDAKSNQDLSTPSTLNDLQEMLDYPNLNIAVSATNIASDEYYLTDIDWQSLLDHSVDKDGYIWDSKTQDNDDWSGYQYNTVFIANTVLDNLGTISSEGQESLWNSIKGSALFFRALSFYQITQIYSKQYDSTTAQSDLGIPLRLTSNFNVASSRSSLQETYAQIIADLQFSIPLLPSDPLHKTRPGKAAAYALLARIYLTIGNYSKAKSYSDTCLSLNQSLIDYNTLDSTASYPISLFNDEVIFHTFTDAPITADDSKAKIDSNLYNSFDSNDLRKVIFFRDNGDGTYAFKGSYSGGAELFSGLATDEILLTRAESNARLGNTSVAIDDLNTLLIKRWKNGTFTPYVAPSADDALKKIVLERRKEMIYRGTRWTDIRRLNKETQFATILTRKVNGQTYTLPPNDLRYTFLIPQDVINLSGMQQNPR